MSNPAVATLLCASPARIQQLAPMRNATLFRLEDFAKILPGEGALRVCRLRSVSPRVVEVLIVRDNGPDAPVNRLATRRLAEARLPVVDPIRGDAIYCFHVTIDDAEAFT